MKEQQPGKESQSEPMTPREAAKDLIRKQMQAGATLETLLNTHPSAWDERYSATVGGTIWRGAGATREYRALEVDQVGVRQIDGQECWGIFPLREIYAEVWEEEHPDELPPGELLQQKQLL
ncbi:MAG: hypothetical protein ACRDJW_01310 [Thermomicrobiales bacterium]